MAASTRFVRFFLPLACAPFVVACGEERAGARADTRIEVDSAGVEIVIMQRMPDLNDPRYRWASRVDLEIPTQIGLDGVPSVFNPLLLAPLAPDTLLVYDGDGDEVFVVLAIETGEAVRRFGRRGAGPEEISGTRWVWLADDGTVRLLDPAGRVFVFARGGTLEAVLPGPVGAMPNAHVRDMGLEPVVQYPSASGGYELVRVTEASDRYETVFLAGLPPQLSQFWYGMNRWVVLPHGIVWTRSDQARYEVVDHAGHLIRRIHLPLTTRTVSDNESALRGQDLPQGLGRPPPGPLGLHNLMYPFGDSIFGLFQSDIWRAAEDPDPPEGGPVLRLISLSGRYMGTIPYNPSNFQPMWIRGSTAWGVALDSLGIPIIQRRTLLAPAILEN